jgi:uncharacterized protein YdeI (YjbR/CyaY-like superfamily)
MSWGVGVTGADLPIVSFGSPAGWRDWLEAEHETSSGVWLTIAKKGDFGYADALMVALCYGWIDGQKRALDDVSWLQRFTPRRRGSRWSKINRQKAQELIDGGLMRPAGQREVDAARADGRWAAAYDGSATATVPDDLAAALAANEAAASFFATIDRRSRYSILYRVQDAKKPETRARRIETFVAMLADGEKPA